MRTPVVLIAGQGDSDRVAGALMGKAGTLVVGHEYDGQVVRRWVSIIRNGELSTSELPLELANGCASCTTRTDLLLVLRRLHRRDDVKRIVVLLAPWLEPEPICWAINNVAVHVGPGYEDGPAARDVAIEAVVTTVDSAQWLTRAVGSDELDDGRTVSQVIVGQAEFADVLVLDAPESTTLAVLRRLAPLARITIGVERVEQALAHLEPDTRRGRQRDPHHPLLTGQPPLDPAGDVTLVEFTARRPFHPQRLHAAVDMLLDGVVRTRGRAFVANRLDDVMSIESAGGGLLIEHAGTWLAAMSSSELAYADPERRALASMSWDDSFGDRHTSMTVLVCGAQPAEIDSALRGALLTDDELSRPDEWPDYPDPFGTWHADPCDELPEAVTAVDSRAEEER